jgi:hypothetical protein
MSQKMDTHGGYHTVYLWQKKYTNVPINWYIQMRLDRSEDFGCTTIRSGTHGVNVCVTRELH